VPALLGIFGSCGVFHGLGRTWELCLCLCNLFQIFKFLLSVDHGASVRLNYYVYTFNVLCYCLMI
jgi:hypothetical protein